jgi:Lysine-specific metallo-endopeptidase
MFKKQKFISLVALFAVTSTLGGCVAAEGNDDNSLNDVSDVIENADAITVSKCTASQQAKVNTYLANALKMTSSSFSYLSNTTASNTRFTTYFGSNTTSRRATVQSMLTKIKTRLTKKDFDISCALASDPVCVGGAIAYAGGTRVGLCPATFAQSDSAAGETIVHEVSHTLGTDDTACGPKNAAVALNGAYCYQGFVYNTLAHRWD